MRFRHQPPEKSADKFCAATRSRKAFATRPAFSAFCCACASFGVPEAVEMRLQLPVAILGQIKRQQIAQAAIDLVKIQPRAIPRNMDRAVGTLRFSRDIPDRPDWLRAMHGFLLTRLAETLFRFGAGRLDDRPPLFGLRLVKGA
jgi:hypothetical protein